MRTTKRILIRIIVAVGVAFILSKLRLLGVMDVSALEVWNPNIDNICFYSSPNSPGNCSSSLNTNNLYGRSWKSYTYKANEVIDTISFGLTQPNIMNKSFHLSTSFIVWNGNVNQNTSYPVRAWLHDGYNSSSCNVEGSNFDSNIGYSKVYVISCENAFQGPTTNRLFLEGPFESANTLFGISTVTFVHDNDMDLALKAQNAYLNDLKNSINNTNNKLDSMIELQRQQNQTQNDIKNNTKETNDLIKNDDTSDADSKGADFFNNFDNNSHGLSGVITAPLSFIQSLTSKSCTPLHLEIGLVNKEFDLPCATTLMQQNFPSVLEFYQTITFGVISYLILIKIFAIVKDAKNPDSDKIEVLDL